MKIIILNTQERIEMAQAIDNAIACLELRYFKHPPSSITEVLYLSQKIMYLLKLKKKFE